MLTSDHLLCLGGPRSSLASIINELLWASVSAGGRLGETRRNGRSVNSDRGGV